MTFDIKAIEKKWAPLVTEGENLIKNEKVRKQTAIMLENQFKYMAEQGMVNEANYGDLTWRSTAYATNGEFQKIAVPMVRRTFPELIAHDLVGVQPLTGPVGIAFALRFKAGQTYDGTANTELGYNTIDQTYTGSRTLSGGERLGSKAPSAQPGKVGQDIGLGIGTGEHIKEVNLTIEKTQVEARTRKLRSRWSLEVAQDLRAMHGLDIEEEMMDILSYEIVAEVDRELVARIRSVANTNTNSCVAGALGTLNWASSGDFDGRWEHEKYRNLYNLLVRKANRVAIDTRRGSGNFAVANPTVCAAFEGTSAFTIAPVANDINTAVNGVAYLGMLDGRIKLYRDTFATADEFVVGYKGASAYDAGIIYLPYIQLMVSKATFEDSFNPAVGLMSRYAIMDHMFGASNYYLRCIITNMP